MVFLAAGQFSDGGHGGTVGLSERSIVSCSVEIKKKISPPNKASINYNNID